MEAGVCEDDHHVVKLGIGENASRRRWLLHNPRHRSAPSVPDKTEFAADNPAMITFPFLPHLGRAAPFLHAVQPLDPVPVRYAQYGRGR